VKLMRMFLSLSGGLMRTLSITLALTTISCVNAETRRADATKKRGMLVDCSTNTLFMERRGLTGTEPALSAGDWLFAVALIPFEIMVASWSRRQLAARAPKVSLPITPPEPATVDIEAPVLRSSPPMWQAVSSIALVVIVVVLVLLKSRKFKRWSKSRKLQHSIRVCKEPLVPLLDLSSVKKNAASGLDSLSTSAPEDSDSLPSSAASSKSQEGVVTPDLLEEQSELGELLENGDSDLELWTARPCGGQDFTSTASGPTPGRLTCSMTTCQMTWSTLRGRWFCGCIHHRAQGLH